MLEGVADGESVDLGDCSVADEDVSGLLFQAGPFTGRTGGNGHVVLDMLSCAVGFGLEVAPV